MAHDHQILGDAISSPPDTPRTQDAPFQPSPREPAFAASTFKPPSLYPNKKPRTERSLEPSPKFHTRSNLSSPGLPSAPYDPTHVRNARRPSIPYTHASSRADHLDARRMSIHQSNHQPHDQISPGSVRYHFERHVREPPSARSNDFARAGYTSREPVGFTTSVGGPSPPLMPYHARPPLDHHSASTDRYTSSLARNPDRRSSIVAPSDYPTPRYEPHHVPGPQPHHSTPQYSLPLRDEYSPRKVPRYEPRGPDEAEAIAGFNRGGFQDAQAAFFMPSHYDYQQGKTRKRSNLPKQSTEIMKTWFDQVCIPHRKLLFDFVADISQNISNPYPSEEQKAIFSNVCSHLFARHRDGLLIVVRLGHWHQHDPSEQLVYQPS